VHHAGKRPLEGKPALLDPARERILAIDEIEIEPAVTCANAAASSACADSASRATSGPSWNASRPSRPEQETRAISRALADEGRSRKAHRQRLQHIATGQRRTRRVERGDPRPVARFQRPNAIRIDGGIRLERRANRLNPQVSRNPSCA
jgi:hypothetical protein